MKRLFCLVTVFLLSSVSYADTYQVKKKYYTSEGIEVEDVYIPNTTVFKYSGKKGYDVKTQGCSVIASLYSQLALEKNLGVVKNVFENWKSIALPLAIYAVATQFPVVKEALVSSQFMSDFLAQLGGTSCESAFNFVNKVNGISKDAVAECMRKWTPTCESSPDPNKCFLEHCGVHKSWYELVTGKTFSNLLKDKSALKKVSEVLAMVNPRTAVECAMGVHVSTDMSKEEFDEQVGVLESKGMSRVEAKTFLILASTIPKVNINSSGMGIEVPKIDGKAVTITRGLKLLQEDMLSDLQKLLSDIESSETEEEVKEKVSEFSSKYGITVSLDNYFFLMKSIKDKLSKDCPVMLSGKEAVPQKEVKKACIARVTAFTEAEKEFTKLISYLYAQRIKEAMLRYLNQVKVYLLQNKGRGVAVCNKIAGTKIDFSPESVSFMVSQIDAVKEQVKTEIDDYLSASGIDDVKKAELNIVKLLAKAVDGKEHAEGEKITFEL